MAKVFHYCGHIISGTESGRFPRSNETKIKSAIELFFKTTTIDTCFGSLAAGADILLAESMVHLGAELHVVLPFDKIAFLEMSVTPSGVSWIDRFNTLLNQAHDVTQIYYCKPEDEELSFALCTIVATGLSIYTAISKTSTGKQIEFTKPRQIAVWDQQQTDGFAGTYPDMVRWQALGFKTDYISSKHPFIIENFVTRNDNHYSGFNIVIYHKTHNHKSLLVNNISELMNALECEPYGAEYFVDLDHNIFGSLTVHGVVNISMRALGLIIYHCYAQQGVSGCKRLLYRLNLCLE